jgi:hypothetical protein
MAAELLKHNNINKTKNSMKFLIIGMSLLLNQICLGQDTPAFTDEIVLWRCSNDTSLKITCRYSNYANIIEISGPLIMNEGSQITGLLKISDGSFEENRLTPQQHAEQILGQKQFQTQDIQHKEVIINQGFFSTQYFYYNINNKPVVTFEGTCKNAKTEKLEKDLQLSPARKKELLEKIEQDNEKPKIKTKTAVIGNRG